MSNYRGIRYVTYRQSAHSRKPQVGAQSAVCTVAPAQTSQCSCGEQQGTAQPQRNTLPGKPVTTAERSTSQRACLIDQAAVGVGECVRDSAVRIPGRGPRPQHLRQRRAPAKQLVRHCSWSVSAGCEHSSQISFRLIPAFVCARSARCGTPRSHKHFNTRAITMAQPAQSLQGARPLRACQSANMLSSQVCCSQSACISI